MMACCTGERLGPCEAARQSSRQVGLIELGAATVIHNGHTQGSRGRAERAWARSAERRRGHRRRQVGKRAERWRNTAAVFPSPLVACNVCARPGLASIIDTECTYGA